jgi:leader peptidase (prepilin peptidase) / N-methyltransferase
MQYYIPLYIIIFLFGIVIGSFLNVCIYRLPLKENIATTGSHCMSCGHGLRWYDLVPLFSWLQLRGRCRYCKARISVQYPLIEVMNGIGYVLIFVVNGICVDSILKSPLNINF